MDVTPGSSRKRETSRSDEAGNLPGEPAHPALRYVDHTYPDIASNLALDEALLLAAEERDGGPVLRVWESPSLAVVLGASSRLQDEVDVERCHQDGVAIARRSSGGGTVVVGPGALNVTVVLPAVFAPGLDAVDRSQAYVLERVATGLRARVPEVRVQGLGDLTLGDRKFAGSAQRRLKHWFLVHLTMMYDFPVAPIVRYTRSPRRQPGYRAGRSHELFLTNINLSRDDLLDALRACWLPPGIVVTPYEVPGSLVDDLVVTRFGDPSWVRRF